MERHNPFFADEYSVNKTRKMTSALAAQLSQLSANPEFTFGTGSGRSEGKLRPSFLFDPKVAATYDLATIHNIGCNGFAQLVHSDSRFAAFELPIFSDAAKDTDRVLQPKSFNDALDKTLHALLLALSPHFLAKPAGKVLEWLIRRFRVNEFNVESVIACILPYYESKQFTHMVTALDLSKSPRWSFLARVVETAKPMDRLFFMRRLMTDRSLVTFAASTVQDRVGSNNAFNTAFTFYITTVISYVTKLDQVTSETASLLMPFIVDGIVSAHKEWRLSNYLVLCKLAARTAFTARTLVELVKALVESIPADDVSPAVTAILALAQSQPEFPRDSDALAALATVPGAIVVLAAASQRYSCDDLLMSMVSSLVTRKRYADLMVLVSGASGIAVPTAAITALVSGVLEAAMPASTDAAIDLPADLVALLHRLQGKYSSALDAGIAEFLSQATGTNRRAAFNVVQHCLGTTVHSVVESLNTTLFLAMRHPEDAYCLAAVQHLAELLAPATAPIPTAAAAATVPAGKSKKARKSALAAAAAVNVSTTTSSPRLALETLAAEDGVELALSLVDALERPMPAIADAVLGSSALIHFAATHAPGATAAAIVAHSAIVGLSPAHVAAAAAVARDHGSALTKDVSVTGAAQTLLLYLRHVQAAHAEWLKAASYTPLPALPTTDEVVALLRDTRYATSGLHFTTPAQLPAVIEPVTDLIVGDSTLDVARTALALALTSDRTAHHQMALMRVLALPDAMLEAAEPLIHDLLTGAGVYARLCPGLRSENAVLVRRCLERIALAVEAIPAGSMDVQSLLPHVLPCLRNTDRAVRDAVVEVIRFALVAMPGASTVATPSNVPQSSGKKNKKGRGSDGKVLPPVGEYKASDVLFADPKVLAPWLTAALESDVAASADAVMHLTYRKRSREVLTAFLSHIPQLDLACAAEWLQVLSRVDSPEVFLALHTHFRARHSALADESVDSPRVRIIVQFIHCLTPSVAPRILQQADALETLTQFLNGYRTPALAHVQQAALTRITSELWVSLSHEQQFDVFYVLLNIVSKSQISDVVLEAKSVLKRIPVSVRVIVDMFTHLITTKGPNAGKLGIMATAVAAAAAGSGSGSNKRAHLADQPMVRQRLGKLTSLLELVSYKDVDDNRLLVAPLFATLQTILNHPAYNQYDYIIQLVLADLLHVEKDGLDDSVFRVDLLVACISSTDNPQTHNSVLLVLSALAPRCADKVLFNVMPIFTFMGAHVLKQDDEYTFTVIESTIEKIIPALLLNVTHVKHVIQVFVDAIQHIPVHRRLRLFTTLIRTLGEEYLYAIVALLLEQEHVKLLEFCLLVSAEFPVAAQLHAMVQLIRMCNGEDVQSSSSSTSLKSVAPKPDPAIAATGRKGGRKGSKGGAAAAASAAAHQSDDDSRLIPLSSLEKIQPPVLMFIDENLMMRSFINSLSKSQVESEVKQFIEALLVLVQAQAENKNLLRLAYGVLDKVHHLLSLSTFLAVVSDLWRHPNLLIQKRAVTMFNDRIGHLSKSTVLKYQRSLMSALPAVMWIFSTDAPCRADPEMLQLGLMALQLLAVHYAGSESHHAEFQACMPTVLAHIVVGGNTEGPKSPSGKKAQLQVAITNARANPAVRASAFVCLSHFIAQLSKRAVKYVNQWMPAVLAFLAEQSVPLNQLSALACIEQSVLHLHVFLTPYLGQVLDVLMRVRVASQGSGSSPQLDLLHGKLDAVAALMATTVPPRHFIKALTGKVASLSDDAEAETTQVVEVARHFVAAMGKDAVKEFHAEVFNKVFLAILGRSQFPASVLTTVVALVMKLNEDLFRPLYAQLLRWYRDAPEPRAVPFFGVVSVLFDALKNLLVPYAGQAFDELVALCDAAVVETFVSATPIENTPIENTPVVVAAKQALVVLHKTALYDTAAVVAADMDRLSRAATSALRVPALTEPASAVLVQMAVTVNDMDAWRILHGSVLAATRADAGDDDDRAAPLEPSVMDDAAVSDWRRAAVAVVGRLFETVGDGYLPLLPETVPAIAECLEDEELERTTRVTVRQMEAVLGEPMDKYLQK
ncbi:hypothetical protein BC828DRAFT_354354 [Blastocladiella britannica]|nr:hypothetical protein BC828DRAFT_354354 [Blastocladiella britannica]